MRHPVLPKVSDHFGEGEEQYLVMEHIAGDDIAKRLEAAQKPFPVSWVMFWADQLLDALSYLHSHEPPIIHRDIKPQNLKLTDENHIILLDFGLSKITTGQTHISNSGSTGSVVGYTPHYAPMEQIRGIGTSPKSDLYSLSATVYQLMTNLVPADALTRADAMLNGLPDPIQPPHELNPEIPATVSEVILKGMEVSQEKRFGTAREMQKALRRAFTKMQEAMAAQTVAFNLGEVATAEPPIPAVDATRLMPTDPVPVDAEPPVVSPAENGDVDFEATLAFDPVENYEQAAVKTEIFAPAETNGDGAPVPELVDAPADVHDSFATVIAAPRPSGVEIPIHRDIPPPPAPAAVVTAPAKKGSRAFAIMGGLLAFLILGGGAATAGWYFYTKYYATAVVTEPSPSPEPTVAETPLPISTEAVVDSNTATETNANSTTVESSEPSASQSEQTSQTQPRSETETNTSRPNPTGPRSNSRPATTPSNKTAPKPKTSSDRTKILQ
jgi:serine/threonine protein kinase